MTFWVTEMMKALHAIHAETWDGKKLQVAVLPKNKPIEENMEDRELTTTLEQTLNWCYFYLIFFVSPISEKFIKCQRPD